VREAGYDGEYGVIRAFDPDDLRHRRVATATLFEPVAPARRGDSGATPPDARLTAGGSPITGGGDQSTLGDQIQVPLGETLAHAGVGAGALSTGEGLDPEQRSAVEQVAGPLLIVAGPGTGKTRTLTHRIAHLVEAHGVAPERCLAITFTRRAAEELNERLRALLPGIDAGVEVATFHALGLRILRERHAAAGLDERFRIADDAERLALVRELAGGLTTEAAARRLLGELSALKRARAAGAGDPAAATAELAATLAHLDEAMRERGLVDLDDLLVLPVRLLTADPALAAAYTERWPHVSVDEYQDVDELQYRLLRLLVPPDGNLCAIGDPDQAIYSFRGADVGFFLRFAADYPSARTIQLTRNYRSSRTIVEGALQAIAPAALVRDRSLAAVRRGPAPLITLHQAASERAEAEFVARAIDKLLGGASFHSIDTGRADGTGDRFAELSFGDIAVLYRTGAQADPIAEALGRAGLPFQKRTHERLGDHAGVQAIVDVLRAWTLPGWRTVAGGNGRGGRPSHIDPAVLAAVLAATEPGTWRRGAAAPAEAADGARPRVPSMVREAASGLLAATSTLPDDADLRGTVAAAVELLAPLAERCGDDLDRFLAELALGAQVDALDPRADRISLLTLHAAKGLEFPVVFVTGCEDGLLPLRFGTGAGSDGGDGAGDAEERRLFFVGMTRARSHLYLTHSRQRTRHGTTRESSPSPFLAEIADALLLREQAKARRPAASTDQLSLL
jgi:DNA helicase-2/ATP-dependent DNA helicase PcrA